MSWFLRSSRLEFTRQRDRLEIALQQHRPQVPGAKLSRVKGTVVQRTGFGPDDAFFTTSSEFIRSKAICDLVRRGLAGRRRERSNTQCFGVVSCAFDQSVRNLGSRVQQGRLERHDQTVAAMSVSLDHSTMIEVAVMQGPAAEVQTYEDALLIKRGVMHGTLALIPVVKETTFHPHGVGSTHAHVHLKVQEAFRAARRSEPGLRF